jgi:hypothetical protein
MDADAKIRSVSSLALVGQVWGEVRRLAAFDKKRHTVPDKVNPVTQGFLEKLCEPELEEEGESLFQAVRQQFDYKRKEISLDCGAGYGRLDTKDFTLELRYELDEDDASSYSLETSVVAKGSRDVLESEAFSSSVGSRYDRLRCRLSGRVSVESIIDAVEGDSSGDLSVEYPSDCSGCTVRIEGVQADVFVDGAVLEVRFGKAATAAALMQAFDGIASRFSETDALSVVLR